MLEQKRERLNVAKHRLLVLASGSGTNFQELINQAEAGNLNANIVGLLSDNHEAGALERARRHNIADIVVSSEGRSKMGTPERTEFEKDLLEKIVEVNPQVIVLAGWMKILSDDFLIKVQEQNIPIINLHPALLTEGKDEFVETSKGKIPVIRGKNAIRDAYEIGLSVSGVTVHEVVPGPFDTGPIILKREVERLPEDTLEDWEARIHRMEYQIFPEAISLVLERLKNE
jgi:formyltetrahydrofolate-dependent phosphoribosylglycinamide formyltransferase